MRTRNLAFGLLIATGLMASCARQNEVITPRPPATAGKGGLAVINITPQFHERNIDTGFIYIGYNDTTKPATLADFDLVDTVGYLSNRPGVMITELKEGTYYIYCEGYDRIDQREVKGGATFDILPIVDSNINNNTYDLYLQVAP